MDHGFPDADDQTLATFSHDEGRPLSSAILDAIGEHRGIDVRRTDFVLYDDIDPDAIDALFRGNAQPRTCMQFQTDSVCVSLRGDGGVEIRVADREPPSK